MKSYLTWKIFYKLSSLSASKCLLNNMGRLNIQKGGNKFDWKSEDVNGRNL